MTLAAIKRLCAGRGLNFNVRYCVPFVTKICLRNSFVYLALTGFKRLRPKLFLVLSDLNLLRYTARPTILYQTLIRTLYGVQLDSKPIYYTRTITKIDQYPRVLAYDQIIGLINISFLVNRPLMQSWKFIKMGTELKTTRNCPVLWKMTSEIVELRLSLC